MNEFLEEAREELKRVDHLIYVSLKYTRTVDVFKSIIERLISCYDIAIEGLLQLAKDKKKIQSIPVSPTLRAETVKELYPKHEQIANDIDFYIFLRKLNKADYTRKNEYRRHVTMTAVFPSDEVVEVTMDTIHGYYERSKLFLNYLEESVL
jgi:hypothetical protein